MFQQPKLTIDKDACACVNNTLSDCNDDSYISKIFQAIKSLYLQKLIPEDIIETMIKDAIREEIKRIFDIDQSNNTKYSNRSIDVEELILLQDKNFEFFNRLIIKHGFLFKDIVGEDSYKQAVTIALHSNPENMKIYAGIFSEINDPFKIDLSDKAYFIDKLRLMEKRPQIYGTQYKKNPDGTIVFKEIEDIENVDDRRKSLGMSTLEEYRRFAEGKM